MHTYIGAHQGIVAASQNLWIVGLAIDSIYVVGMYYVGQRNLSDS